MSQPGMCSFPTRLQLAIAKLFGKKYEAVAPGKARYSTDVVIARFYEYGNVKYFSHYYRP